MNEVKEYTHRAPFTGEWILCSECHDKHSDGRVLDLIPQSECMNCGRPCMGYVADRATAKTKL